MNRSSGRRRTAILATAGVATLFTAINANRAVADGLIRRAQLRERSTGWYVLSQPDGRDLLHGLPQRLGLAAASDRKPANSGDATLVTAALTVEFDGDLDGDLFVGVFDDARFFVDAPVAVYQFSGPGQYEVQLPEGAWSLGAMVGLPPYPEALGVDHNWPQPVRIVAGEQASIHVLVSPDFRALPAGQSQLEEGFASLWEFLDPVRLAMVRTYDSNGDPSPFNSVTFVERDERRTRSFHQSGADHLGNAYCDEIDGTFSLMLQRFDVVPENFLFRWHAKKFSRLHDAMDRPVIDFQWEEFPNGTGQVVGLVHDQHGQPLSEYFLTLKQQIGEASDWSDADTIAFKQAVLDSDGRFEFAGLPSGEYTALIRHFDYETHAWSFNGPKVVIPETRDAVVSVDWEVEAKDRFYGQVQYEDGSPLRRGMWEAHDFANRVHDDGTFRVCLSRAEQDRLRIAAGNTIDVKGANNSLLLRIPLTELSRDPQNPTVFILE